MKDGGSGSTREAGQCLLEYLLLLGLLAGVLSLWAPALRAALWSTGTRFLTGLVWLG